MNPILAAVLAKIIAIVTAFLIMNVPCQQEDDYNCHWNASEQGNGQGTSFTNIGGVVIPD